MFLLRMSGSSSSFVNKNGIIYSRNENPLFRSWRLKLLIANEQIIIMTNYIFYLLHQFKVSLRIILYRLSSTAWTHHDMDMHWLFMHALSTPTLCTNTSANALYAIKHRLVARYRSRVSLYLCIIVSPLTKHSFPVEIR